MIVDDNVEFLTAARGLLEREGLTVVGVASNSTEALRAVADSNPDVVLVDVDLGDESGFDLAGRLSPPVGRRTPVVMISAYLEEDLEDLILGSPAIGFVPKLSLTAAAIVDLVDRHDRKIKGDPS
jgi:CheY-like chemotaxis protein